jgi:TRAP-type C4-dicarboxylate transport system substrate-binding protein
MVSYSKSRIHAAISQLVLFVSVVLVATLIVCPTVQAAKYTMTISHLFPDDLTNNEVAPSMERFKQVVESGTKGEVEVKVFGNLALGSEVETGKQAQNGKTIQSVLMSSGATSSFFKNYQIVSSPFLFSDYQTAWEFFDSAYFAKFMDGAKTQSGLRYLGTFDDGGGFVAFTNNKRLIKTVADLKGMKIRVEENPAHVSIIKALGAIPTPLPWSEVPTALTTGLADGQFNAPGVNSAFKLYDTTKYTTWSGHLYNTVSWFVSDKWLQKLPREYQLIIVKAAREAVTMGHGIATQASVVGWVNSAKKFKEAYILPEAEKMKMREITQAAFKNWIVNDYGIDAGLLEEFWSEVDKLGLEINQRDAEYYLK